MNPAPARSSWRGPTATGGPAVRGADRCVRGSGPGAVDAYDDLVDEVIVRRALLHQSQFEHLPLTALTLAERREVARRICERFPDPCDGAAWIGATAHVLRAYRHWSLTDEWISPGRITAVLRERAAQGV